MDFLLCILYDNFTQLDWHLERRNRVEGRAQKTNYPWDGAAEISVAPAKPAEFTFYLRIPRWSDGTQVTVNGKPVSGATPGQYLALRRRWASGDVINVKFGMTPQVIEANARVVDDYGRVAVQRGRHWFIVLNNWINRMACSYLMFLWMCGKKALPRSTRSFAAICLVESWC